MGFLRVTVFFTGSLRVITWFLNPPVNPVLNVAWCISNWSHCSPASFSYRPKDPKINCFGEASAASTQKGWKGNGCPLCMPGGQAPQHPPTCHPMVGACSHKVDRNWQASPGTSFGIVPGASARSWELEVRTGRDSASIGSENELGNRVCQFF